MLYFTTPLPFVPLHNNVVFDNAIVIRLIHNNVMLNNINVIRPTTICGPSNKCCAYHQVIRPTISQNQVLPTLRHLAHHNHNNVVPINPTVI